MSPPANPFALEYVRGACGVSGTQWRPRAASWRGERPPTMSQVKTELKAARLPPQAAVNGPKMDPPEIAPGDGLTPGRAKPMSARGGDGHEPVVTDAVIIWRARNMRIAVVRRVRPRACSCKAWWISSIICA